MSLTASFAVGRIMRKGLSSSIRSPETRYDLAALSMPETEISLFRRISA
jgi:hypothetical protein